MWGGGAAEEKREKGFTAAAADVGLVCCASTPHRRLLSKKSREQSDVTTRATTYQVLYGISQAPSNVLISAPVPPNAVVGAAASTADGFEASVACTSACCVPCRDGHFRVPVEQKANKHFRTNPPHRVSLIPWIARTH